MPRRLCAPSALAAIVLAIVAAWPPRLIAAPSAGPGAPAIHGAIAQPIESAAPLPAQIVQRAAVRALAAPEGAWNAQLYPSYTWPLEHVLHEGVNIVNYVDEDPTAGILDYRGGAYTYDTHRGTDIALNDFRAMDRGQRIVAAAPGVVTYAVWANLRDRNCAVPDDPTLNYIEVANGDGTYTYYYHLRANSMTVNLGESVQRGEVLGLAGSSGYSYGPHLHFEAADWLGGPYVRRDPWGGPSNPNPGLWAAQSPYVGDEPIRFDDAYVTTETAMGGNINNVDYCTYFAERMTQPAVIGIHEPYLPVILLLHARVGETYRVELRRPDASLWAWVDYTMPGDMSEGSHWWAWYWNGYVNAADYGTWTAVTLLGGVPVRTVPFVVGPGTIYSPRFVPRDGHSFRIDGAVHRDTLHVSPLGGPVTYSLRGAPSTVTLADSILTVGATSSQPTRSAYFQLIATDAGARTDTAWYHVVDPVKPQEPIAAVEAAVPTALTLAPAYPMPAHGAATLRFALPRAGRVTLAIHDLAGRRVRTLIDGSFVPTGGGRAVTWDGRDNAGQRAPAGVYFALLGFEGERLSQRVVVLP